jgi:hypothetical protein
MPYSGTPEERQAKAHAHYLRNREKLLPKQKARDAARKDAMTPEEMDAFKARQRAAVRRYENKHRPKRMARKKTTQYRRTNATAQRARRAKDPEKTRALARAAYHANPQKAIASTSKWTRNNPEKAQAIIQRRRARVRGLNRNDVTEAQRKIVKAAARGVCAYCAYYNPGCRLCRKNQHKKLTVDHITSVYHHGDNTLHNLVASCSSCNSKKSTNPNPIPVQPMLL